MDNKPFLARIKRFKRIPRYWVKSMKPLMGEIVWVSAKWWGMPFEVHCKNMWGIEACDFDRIPPQC
jgi:hypothetical protein